LKGGILLTRKLKFYGLRDIDRIPQLQKLSDEQRFNIKVVANVLPFRTNNYVVEELIDWDNVADDPIFQLTFMQRQMLLPEHFNKMAALLKGNADSKEIMQIANQIRLELNPNPNGQMTANVPSFRDEPVPGVQHKYRETCLVFPSSGQTCHAYCTFCFRWSQFVGLSDLKFATDESNRFQQYLKANKNVSDVLFTGGDPMVMSYKKLQTYIEPLLQPEFDHIRNIRIGTKSISYWPYRYVSDKDSDDILGLFERVMSAGKHLAIMAHFNHWKELSTPIVHRAIRRLRNVGVKIRSQSPVIRHINDNSHVWARMWKDQVNLGIIPYYMFVERDTGASNYFSIPLAKAFRVYRDAFKQVSGLSRTARGPSMSAKPGKVAIDGITEINGERVFVLNFLQARDPEWVKRPFFARYDETSTWLDQLEPAFGEEKFFFEERYKIVPQRIQMNYTQKFI
jgi:KamA family protein